MKKDKRKLYDSEKIANFRQLVNKYKTQAKYFKTRELKEILQALSDLDYNYKNGLIDLQVGMESILCRYCS